MIALPAPLGAPGAWLVHHHRDLAAEMLLVEAERRFAISAEVQLGVELHEGLCLLFMAGTWSRLKLLSCTMRAEER